MSSSSDYIGPESRSEGVSLPDMIAQMRSLAQRENLSAEIIIEARSALFNALTIDGENLVDIHKLNDAIAAGESLLKVLPSSHKDCFKYLDKLAFTKTSRYKVNNNESDMNDAVCLGRQALCLVPIDGPEFPNIASNLAYSLSQVYKAAKRLDDLDESIRLTRDTVEATQFDTSKVYGHLLNLGARLHLRYQATGDPENNSEALAVTHQVLQLSKPGSPEHSAALLNIGTFAGDKYDKTGFWKDLEEAIILQKHCMNSSTSSSESRSQCIHNLAALYDRRFATTKNISDLKKAVGYQSQAVQALPISNSMQSTRGHHLTIYLKMLTELARATTEVSDVERAISNAADLLNPTPKVYADLLLNLRSYGDLFSRKYELSGHPIDLHQNVTSAISFASQCNQVTDSKGEPTKYDTNTLLILYYHTGKLVVEPQGDPLVVQVVEAMHKEYLKLVKTMSFIDALIKLEKDISINVQIIIIAPRSKSIEDIAMEREEKAGYVKSLGAKTYQVRIKMIDLTIGKGPVAIAADPTQELSDSLVDWSSGSKDDLRTERRWKTLIELDEKSYHSLRDQSIQGNANLPGLKLAASSSETLSNLLKDKPVERSGVLDRLTGIFVLLYQKDKVETDLLKASDMMKKSLHLRLAGVDKNMDNTRLEILCPLAHTLRLRHVETRDEKILEDSKTLANEIIASTKSFKPGEDSRDDYFIISGKTALSKTLRSEYLLKGDVGCLDKAIQHVQECYQLRSQIPPSEATHFVDLVNQYALMMRSRFAEYGELRDLDIAIESIQDFLNENCQKLSTGDKSVLTSNLGLLYEQKCERSQALPDIQKAIKYCQEAMGLARDSGMGWEVPCINLGSALLEKYWQSKNMEDLTQAVEHVRMALDKPPNTYNAPSDLLMDAATILKASYQRTRDPAELEQAGEYMEKSMSQMPSSHVGRALYLYEHGGVLEELNRLKPSEIAIDKAIEAYKSALNCSSGSVRARLGAANSLARLLCNQKMWNELLHSLEEAIKCIKIVCPTWLPVGDRQYFLSMVPGLAADTAAATLQVSTSNAYDAIHSLELSRGIILGSTIDHRSEDKHLEAVSPDHFTQWNHLCMELDLLSQESRADGKTTRRQKVSTALTKLTGYIRQIPSMESFSPPIRHGSLVAYEIERTSPELFGAFNALQRELESLPIEHEGGRGGTKRWRELLPKLNSLRSRIRSIPGLEEFLLPLSHNALLNLARRGPVFVVNCSGLVGRSDAFIIQSSGIEVLRLPMLLHADVERWMNERDDVVQGWTLRTFPLKNARMRDVLRWLWQTIVKPILSHLNMMSDVSDKRKPHVYWIGTGRLSTAPFHAAGEHESHSTENTISHTISTYSPTLRALSFARESSPGDPIYSISHRHLFIADARSAPGAAALPSVEEEISQITTAASSYATIVRNSSPTPASVLSELPLANIVHFACHAVSDPIDVANSHLLLHAATPSQPDPSPTPESDPLDPLSTLHHPLQADNTLDVRAISAMRSPFAELAYLSVCSAAETRNASLADESIHIASAFQLAGFRHVVGTLWLTKDECCREVAGGFYRRLFGKLEKGRKGKGRDGVGGEMEQFLPVAEALHDAVVELRAENPEKVLAWAPFVCFGA